MQVPLSTGPERLVKSSERVRELGEVFTPRSIVEEMLDLLPTDSWKVHPSSTFLEPSCGDGNFLAAIYERKLESVAKNFVKGVLPAGDKPDDAMFHAVEGLASLYGMDISRVNIVGGVKEHSEGARQRLVGVLIDWAAKHLDKKLTSKSPWLRTATWVVTRNVQVANMLPESMEGGNRSRSRIPLIEYLFSPETKSVSIFRTTLGDVLDASHAEIDPELMLFGPVAPTLVWSGNISRLSSVDI